MKNFFMRIIHFASQVCHIDSRSSGCYKTDFEGLEASGHDFSRAAKSPKRTGALVPQGMQMVEENLPQGLKPSLGFAAFAARLKSCPFKAAEFKVSLGLLGSLMIA